jgi:hypothetical protein
MINKLKFLTPLIAVVALAFALVSFMPVNAQDTCNSATPGSSCVTDAISAANGTSGGQITLQPAFGFTTIGQALSTIISIIFLVAGLLAFVFILLGAFSYLTAGDDSAKTQKARTQITNAVVGLILVALVYVIWLLAINLIPGMKVFFNVAGTAAAPQCAPGVDC